MVIPIGFRSDPQTLLQVKRCRKRLDVKSGDPPPNIIKFSSELDNVVVHEDE